MKITKDKLCDDGERYSTVIYSNRMFNRREYREYDNSYLSIEWQLEIVVRKSLIFKERMCYTVTDEFEEFLEKTFQNTTKKRYKKLERILNEL